MVEQAKLLDFVKANYSDIDCIDFFRDGGSTSYITFGVQGRRFLRLIKPAFQDVALRSMDIQTYLAANGIPVPQRIPTNDGRPFVRWESDEGEHLCVLYEYLEGGETDPQDIEAVGAAVGKMHRVMRNYPGLLETRDKHFFTGRYLEILERKKYPRLDAFRQIGDEAWDSVQHLPRGFCHGDLYHSNIFKTADGTVYVLDLDTACNAFPVYDIALFCNAADYFQLEEDGCEKTRRAVETFLRGYRQHSTMSDGEVAAIDDLLAVYHFQVQATVIEIFGLDCVDEAFVDAQLDWLQRWREQCEDNRRRQG